jgi:hypothetical protein
MRGELRAMRSGRFQNTGTSTACPSANSVSVLSLARSLRDGTTVDTMIAGVGAAVAGTGR